jgi:DNA-binding XRE family transcriptional regulator
MTKQIKEKTILIKEKEEKYGVSIETALKNLKFEGLTNKQISFILGVHKNTISNWMRDYLIPKRPIERVWERETVCI